MCSMPVSEGPGPSVRRASQGGGKMLRVQFPLLSLAVMLVSMPSSSSFSTTHAFLAAKTPLQSAARSGFVTRLHTVPRGSVQRSLQLRSKSTSPRMQDSSPTKRFPEPVRGFFPLWENNFLQTFGLADPDQAVVADLPLLAQAIADRPKDYLDQLLVYSQKYGGVFKVCLGPKAFLIVSDPGVVKHILAENTLKYDKGILADILEPIMGRGLIPADLQTWSVRRKAVVPAFHTAWMEQMVSLFNDCSERLIDSLEQQSGKAVDMEAMFSNVALDIIGKAVFNFEFGSVGRQSPVIDAVYALMQEAEHRSFFPLPYWKVPLLGHKMLGMGPLVQRQGVFASNLEVINSCLDELVAEALLSRSEADVEALEQRDYSSLANPSLLRFLVDMRGADATERQLRDDLMTMLIAGHETTAALLTFALLSLLRNPEHLATLRSEIDAVLGDRNPTFQDLPKLEFARLVLAEALRLYPQPPILIRRALEDDTLPLAWGNTDPVKVFRGSDIFMLVWNLHRSPQLWGKDAAEFNPYRFTQPRTSADVPSWQGYTPKPSQLYPNEVMSDYAFCPFGAGPRKCVGDQFAFMEAIVILVQVVRRFEIAFEEGKEDVELATGATIHTESGLWCTLAKR